MRGEQITSVAEFDRLVKSGAVSVWADNWRRPSPISFLINWQYNRLSELIERGYLYTNLPPDEKPKHKTPPFINNYGTK
jgi:hypothetical protein